MRVGLLTIWSLLAAALSLAGSPEARAFDYHTSPECWDGPRIHLAGPVPDDPRFSLEIERVPIGGSPDPMVLSDNGAYGFRLAVHPGDAESGHAGSGEILIYNERAYLIRLSGQEVHSLDAKWINESWLFVRIWWGRIAGSDVIFDVEGEEILHQAQFYWGQIAFQQYKQACGDSCPCDYSGLERED